MHVHMYGAATVCAASKKLVEQYVKAFETAGLSVSMAPDEDFESTDPEKGLFDTSDDDDED
jgi:hypothetical protein